MHGEGEQMAVKSVSLTLYELYLNQKSDSGVGAAGPARGLVAEALRQHRGQLCRQNKEDRPFRASFQCAYKWTHLGK